VVSVAERPRTPAAARQLAVSAPTQARGAGAIPHFPGLEGLRGLAVVAVVAFHAQFTWARGGFLGVSTFFTLSGFLITSLLLNERGATGTINLRQFWKRRFRRLMPAALAALALVIVFGATVADEVQRRNLAGDVLASLGYVANWRFLLAHQSYADIFGAASPVAHFWSLAIEEQFYLLLPLVAWFLLIKLKLGRGAFAVCLAGLTAASLGLIFGGGLTTDASYYHTGTRAAELLIGALMAAAVFDRRVTRPLGRNRAVQVVVCTIGVLALAACVFLWSRTEQMGQQSPWLYKGGFALYSLLTVAVVLASVTPAGPVRWLLALWPLRALGMISYGIYLYHWPIFLWLTPARTKLDDPLLTMLRVGVTISVAIVSYYVIESPIRHAGKKPRVPLASLAIPTVVILAGAVIAVTATAPKAIIDFEAAQAAMATSGGSPPPPPPDIKSAEAPFARIGFYGDSTSLMTGIGMKRWAQETNQADVLGGVSRLGCGIGRGGYRKDEKGEVIKVPDVCNRWELEFRQSIENDQPTVAVVQIGPWEVAPRKLDGTDNWTGPGDPAYDKFMMDEMLRAIDVLTSKGAVVTWLSAPRIRVDPKQTDRAMRGATADPARMDRLNELIRELPAKRPGKVAVVDLAGWLDKTGEDQRLRTDGIHFDDSTTAEVAKRFLGEAVLSTYRDLWSKRAHDTDPTATSDVAGQDSLGRYLTNKYKALLVGDSSADLVAAGVNAWVDKTSGLQVSTAIRPDCGLLKTSARQGTAGKLDPTPPDCQSFRQWVLDRVRAEQPDIVIIIPSQEDLGPVRLSSTSATARWGDSAFEKTATQHYQDLVRQINQSKAVVMWANLPLGAPDKGGPGAAAKLLPNGDQRTAERYDASLAALQAADNKGMRRLDMANWTYRNLPALREGGDLSVESKMALGEWVAAQAYLEYDGNPKLKPEPPR
jgi:peptidoglycan/LPS O-acetylase OafA/YrhL